jgi:predicted MFS family arabinose efflux permease
VFALAGLLALDAADRSALGALAPAIKHEFGVGNAAIGLLGSAFAVVGALATIPIGVLTDRTRRVTLLVICVVAWSIGMGVAAAATTFAVLFIARISLGIVTAAGGPPVTSMVGDLFPSDVRGRMLGWLKSGELVGAGAGFLLTGLLVWILSWRSVFVVLGALGLLVAWHVGRLEEPPRGGEGRTDGEEPTDGERALDTPSPLRDLVEKLDVEAPPSLVLHGDQSRRSLLSALRYVLSVRTVFLVISASALAEFFFAALQVFGILFLVEQYDVSVTTASLLILAVGVGGLVGVVAGGRVGDLLIERGVIAGRLRVGSWSYLAVSVVFLPVFLSESLWVALPCLLVASAFLFAPVAPLEAARLDVVHPQLRGRAESARLIFRVVAQASAPLLFGVLSEDLGGGGAEGLRAAFLVLLPLLAVSSILLALAARPYPEEVAAVQESTVEVDQSAPRKP